jgi:hypothetical protein
MSVEPEFLLFVAAALLTLVVAVLAGLLIRHAWREEREERRR